MGLAVSVLFSSIAGYLLGIDDNFPFDWEVFAYLMIGGYCMVGASNAFNQVMERESDKLMDRTKNRPVPSGELSAATAFALAVLLTVVGVWLLYLINFKSAFFGTLSIVLYTLVYTPLKRKSPLAVFVGAFPGAIPFMLGWVAATDSFGIEAGTLFLIQFFWQFPHFWAIGWFLYEDYAKANIFMLPTGHRDHGTAMQIILYTMWLIVASLLPVLGITGSLKLSWIGAIVVGLLGIWMLFAAFKLYHKRTAKVARSLMLVSVTYISLLQIVYVIDKFLR